MERDDSGVDHTLWRKYESRAGRWTTPDPYGGSMSVGDPQSFNRYAYVANDPVNFADPIGLEGEGPWRPWGVLLNPERGSGGRSGGVMYWRYYVREEIQNPEPPRPTGDCARFADLVEQLANENIGARQDYPGADVQQFMNRLATTFTEFSAARFGAVVGAGTIEPVNTGQQRFGSSGFASSYFEPDANQVRHAVGGLIAGYVGISLARMNARENPSDPIHGVPDINLNRQTVPMGARL